MEKQNEFNEKSAEWDKVFEDDNGDIIKASSTDELVAKVRQKLDRQELPKPTVIDLEESDRVPFIDKAVGFFKLEK